MALVAKQLNTNHDVSIVEFGRAFAVASLIQRSPKHHERLLPHSTPKKKTDAYGMVVLSIMF
jgi:hypothetical protein